MKKQFLHEHHNLQDKTKKPDYQDGFLDEGNRFDRGGVGKKRLFSFGRSTVYFNLRQFLEADKQSLKRTLENMKFIMDGQVGTVSQLMKNPKLARQVRDCHEMTQLCIARACCFVDIATHPKEKTKFRVVEFTSFLQPMEPFPNPIFKKSFAFRMNVAKRRSAD